jgi:hypothetical protein
MNQIKVFLKNGQVDSYEDGKLGFDGCGTMMLDLPDGSRISYNENFVLKYTQKDGKSRERQLKNLMHEMLKTSI